MRNNAGSWRMGALLGSLLGIGLLVLGCTAGSDDRAAVAPGRSSEQATDQGASGISGQRQSQRSNQSQRPNQSQGLGASDQRQVIRNAELNLEVREIARTTAKVRRIGQNFGGYLASENSRRNNAHLVVKVPGDQLGRALDQVARLGRVTLRNQHAKDVTDQVVDTRSRIESQRASVDRLRALMGEAQSVGDIVEIEDELTARETELDSLERRQAALDHQVDLATLTVRLTTPPDAPQERDGPDFLAGLVGGWRALIGLAGATLAAIGAALPFVLVIGVPAGALWAWRRRKVTHALSE